MEWVEGWSVREVMGGGSEDDEEEEEGDAEAEAAERGREKRWESLDMGEWRRWFSLLCFVSRAVLDGPNRARERRERRNRRAHHSLSPLQFPCPP